MENLTAPRHRITSSSTCATTVVYQRKCLVVSWRTSSRRRGADLRLVRKWRIEEHELGGVRGRAGFSGRPRGVAAADVRAGAFVPAGTAQVSAEGLVAKYRSSTFPQVTWTCSWENVPAQQGQRGGSDSPSSTWCCPTQEG